MIPPFGGALHGGGGTASVFKLAISAGLLAMGLNDDVNRKDQTAVAALVAGTTGLASAIPAMDAFARKIIASRRTQIPANLPRSQRARPHPKRAKLHTISAKSEPKLKPQSSKTERVYIPPTKTRNVESSRSALYGAALCTMVGVGTSVVIGRSTNVKENTDTMGGDALVTSKDFVFGGEEEETLEKNKVTHDTAEGLKTLLHILSFLVTVKDDTNKNRIKEYYSARSVTVQEAVHRHNSNSIITLLVLLYFYSTVHDAAHLKSSVCVVDTTTWILDLANIGDAASQLQAFRTFPYNWVDYSNTELEIPLPEGLVYSTVIPLADFLDIFGLYLSPTMYQDLLDHLYFPFIEHVNAHLVSSQAVDDPFIEDAYYILWDRRRRSNFGLPKNEDYEWSDEEGEWYEDDDEWDEDEDEDLVEDISMESDKGVEGLLSDAIEEAVEDGKQQLAIADSLTMDSMASVSTSPRLSDMALEEQTDDVISTSSSLPVLSVAGKISDIDSAPEIF